jgi:DNA polymerase-3 subunit gamma/tau
MSYQVLARKWRPRRFADLVGQPHVVRALANALDHDRLHHAYLFTGTRGIGKTTVARIFARALNCETGISATPCGSCSACREIDEGRFVDLIEVDAASRTKVDDTRELLDNVQYAPTRGRYKVYLIDEVHMFSGHSFNALLKTLEEPPPHVKFLLATTDPKKLPVTILSRCLQFNLRRLAPDEIEAQLARIMEAESVPAEPDALRLIAFAADGSLRDALSLLDQAIAYGGGRLVTAEVAAMLGTIDRGRVYELIEGLIRADAAGLLASVKVLADAGCDLLSALGELLGVLQRIAIHQIAGPTGDSEEARIADFAARMPAEDCQLYYQIGLIGRRDLPHAPDPRGAFEMVLLRMLVFRPASATAIEAPVPVPAARSATTAGTGIRASAAGAAAASRRAGPAAPADDPARPVRAEAARQAAPASPLNVGDESWAHLLEELGLAGLARELAANCVYAGRDGEEFRLVLSPRCAQLRNPKYERRIEELLRARFGPELRLVVTVSEARTETPVARQARLTQAEEDDAARSIAADPHVQTLLERFDGRITATSAKPADETERASQR